MNIKKEAKLQHSYTRSAEIVMPISHGHWITVSAWAGGGYGRPTRYFKIDDGLQLAEIEKAEFESYVKHWLALK